MLFILQWVRKLGLAYPGNVYEWLESCYQAVVWKFAFDGGLEVWGHEFVPLLGVDGAVLVGVHLLQDGVGIQAGVNTQRLQKKNSEIML